MPGDNDPITLADAAAHFGFTVWTLRAEAERGHLTIYKIGKRLYTTPGAVKEMIELCRVEPKAPASILTPGERLGSSETERISSAQAALNQTVQRLKSPSLNTLAGSTSRSRAQTR